MRTRAKLAMLGDRCCWPSLPWEVKASEILLKPAFAELHGIRADRYGFRRRPEDFRAALRELAGAFIKPVSTHSVEVLDPSVLDLLNRART